jgi:hypothetical protein
MKKCTKCNIEKELNSFQKSKRTKDGLRSDCKSCRKESTRFYREKNKEKIKEEQKKFIDNNKDYFKKYAENNKESLKEYKKKYKSDNMDKHKEYQRKHRDENKENINKYHREYRAKNKDKFELYYEKSKEKSGNRYSKKRNEYFKQYSKLRKKEDPLFRLSCNLRTLISNAIRKNYTKNSKTEDILECSFKDFKLYLESKFEPWMNWSNYGIYDGLLNSGWDIDHIVPLSSAETDEEIIKLNHHTNLQPLCSKTNRDIKKDNL